MNLRLIPVLAVLLAGCTTTPAAPVATSAVVAPVSQAPTEPRAVDVLGALPVRDRDPVGYTREAFGPAWTDIDGNHCDTRNDVLLRDLADPEVAADGCTVVSGVLRDPYSGHELTFTRGASTSSKVQIDHVVSLADAWRSGANTWTPQQRLAYANDPANLLAVSGTANQAKSDKTAAEWRPENPQFGCRYAGITVATKAKYHLSVFEAERQALADLLHSCPTEIARGVE